VILGVTQCPCLSKEENSQPLQHRGGVKMKEAGSLRKKELEK
jgi:hypothetical protein